jgi:hypothetical protein
MNTVPNKPSSGLYIVFHILMGLEVETTDVRECSQRDIIKIKRLVPYHQRIISY